MRIAAILALVLVLPPARAAASDDDGMASLAFCEIRDTSGRTLFGLVHVATRYAKGDLSCTNGFLLVNDRRGEPGGEPVPVYTRLSLASGKELSRGQVVEWLGLRDRPREYVAPSAIMWVDDTRVWFMRDVTHDCERRDPRASRATTIDKAGVSTTCTYTYELRDRYELLDHVPVLLAIPDSFTCGQFFGGEELRVPIGELESFRFVFEEEGHPRLRAMLDAWLGGMPEEERAEATRRGFRIEASHKQYRDHLPGITKPDFLSE
ncbi:MAG: hypothetical protein JW876_04995 [Candidatus Krumholzibacteriota bacterium]|nr:hypothetical protein [Candidatus Krumholzibacteriota bacterium]